MQREMTARMPTLVLRRVTMILVTSESLPLYHAKSHLSKLTDRAIDEHERVVVTRKGRPAAVLVSPDDLESLVETLSVRTRLRR